VAYVPAKAPAEPSIPLVVFLLLTLAACELFLRRQVRGPSPLSPAINPLPAARTIACAFYFAVERGLSDSLNFGPLNMAAVEASFAETVGAQNAENLAVLAGAVVECAGGRDGYFDVLFCDARQRINDGGQ
jgi:hypothetical protein